VGHFLEATLPCYSLAPATRQASTCNAGKIAAHCPFHVALPAPWASRGGPSGVGEPRAITPQGAPPRCVRALAISTRVRAHTACVGSEVCSRLPDPVPRAPSEAPRDRRRAARDSHGRSLRLGQLERCAR